MLRPLIGGQAIIGDRPLLLIHRGKLLCYANIYIGKLEKEYDQPTCSFVILVARPGIIHKILCDRKKSNTKITQAH